MWQIKDQGSLKKKKKRLRTKENQKKWLPKKIIVEIQVIK